MKYRLMILILIKAFYLQASENKYPVIINNFTTSNLASSHAVNAVSIIRNNLSGKKFFIISPNELELNLQDCDKDCIYKISQMHPNALFISGSITRIENIIGEKRISKYLVEDLKEEKYLFTVKVINLQTNSTDIFFEREFPNTKEISLEAEKIAGEINQFYSIETPDTPEIEQIEEKPPFFVYTGFSIMPAYLKTAGDYKNIADGGYGISSSLYASTSKLEQLYIALNINAFSLQNTQDRIDSAYMFSSHLVAGYKFNIYKNIKLSPLAGPGYTFHYIDGDRNSTGSSTSDFYYNPSFIMGAETSWSFTENYELIFRPSWGIFFEENSNPHYMLLNLGIRKNF